MKICHMTSVHKYNDIRIFLKECTSLAKNGFDVHLVAANAPTHNVNNVHIHGVNIDFKNRFERMTKVTKSVFNKAVEIDADLYHFHDPELIPAGLKLLELGKIVVYDVHEDVPKQIMSKPWIPTFFRFPIAKLFEWYERRAAKKMSGIVAATPYISDRFKKYNCRTVNVNNYPMLNELISPDVIEESKDKTVAYVGGITQIRGIREMVTAVEGLNIKLALAGSFSSTTLKREIMSLPGWNNVINCGFLSREQVAGLLSKAVAGLVLFHPYPNHTHSQPNKMFEYMSAGLPVICSDFSLWREIIEGNRCGICVNPLDPIEIRQAIEWIISNPEEAKKMGKNGRMAIEEKYNWETESMKLINFYNVLSSQ